jgi:Firmicute plasmid replication protein (RepL).
MNNKSLLIERVYKLELTQRATLVAFYLINRADQENTCFPGVKTIAKECHMSSRTVQRALNDLEEAGLIKRESRFHEMGGQRSNMYYLQVDEMDRLENFAEEISSTQGIVRGEALEEVDCVEGDKMVSVRSSVQLDYLALVENIDFSMYTREHIAKLPLSWGLCQRDGP